MQRSRACLVGCSRALYDAQSRAVRLGKGRTPSFLLDIDGVLIGNDRAVKAGRRAFELLGGDNALGRPLPFCLLTNGGGTTDAKRLARLNDQLGVKLKPHQLVQSHSPFATLLPQSLRSKGKRVYVVGRGGRAIAQSLGIAETVDFQAHLANRPEMWPFHRMERPPKDGEHAAAGVALDQPIDAVLVFHDSTEWGSDTQIMLDILSSHRGVIDDPKDPADARQWTADRQVPLYWSNGDLIFSNAFPRPRLGQGAFRVAFEAVFERITGHALHSTTIGKPERPTYDFALERLREGAGDADALGGVYMVGDNPASDIAGANNAGLESVLIRTGVYAGGKPAHEPTTIKDDVVEAIEWAVERERKRGDEAA